MVEKNILGSDVLGKGIRISDLENAERIGGQVVCSGLDGQKVRVSVTENTISLSEDGDFIFLATLEGDVVHFVINNQNQTEKSKTIFPRQLVEFTFAKWGSRIQMIKASWKADWGVNTVQYRQAIESGKSPVEAAFSTWTGSTVRNFGFSRITKIEEVVSENQNWIYVSFERSGS